MNTQSLQKHFKSEYEDFFAKNDLVLSACHSLPRNLGFGANKNKIHIKHKIPLKTFVGISGNNQSKVVLGHVKMFDVTAMCFEGSSFKDVNKQHEEIENKILHTLKKLGYDKGITVNWLSESPRGHGLGFSGVTGTLLATALYLLAGKVSQENLDNYDNFVASEVFKEIFLLAWEIDYISKYHNSAGHNCYNAMMNTTLPTVTFCEDYDMKDSAIGSETYTYKIKDFLGIKNQVEEIHLDYGVIFSGVKNKVEDNNQIFLNTENSFDELQQKVLNIFKDNDLRVFKKFSFKNIFQTGFVKTLEDAFFVYNFKLLQAFRDLVEKGFDEMIIRNFIQTIKENNALGSLFDTDNKVISSLLWRFDFFKKFDDEIVGIFPISTAKIGGSFVFVMKPHKSRDTFLKTLEKLQEIGYKNLRLEYASWLDGPCSDGIKIQQWIHAGIFSEYIQKDQIYYKDNTGASFVGNYSAILSEHKEGLLLDMIYNRIYFNGKKLTSADLCSQTATINVLEKLLNHIGQDVSNKEFEISSYSKNKNEMLGKIVLPLITLIEKETGEHFPLICKGSIYDFYMKLNPSNLKVSLIKKI